MYTHVVFGIELGRVVVVVVVPQLLPSPSQQLAHAALAISRSCQVS